MRLLRPVLFCWTPLLFIATSAQAQIAESGNLFKTNGIPNIPLAGKSTDSEYKLGRNQTRVEDSKHEPAAIVSKYNVIADKNEKNEQTAQAKGRPGYWGAATVATAKTTISDVKTIAEGGFGYGGNLTTSVEKSVPLLAPEGFARAVFRDPQFVSDPGIYASDFTLLAGTKLFSDLPSGRFDVGFSLAGDFYNGTENPIDVLGLQIFEIVADRTDSLINVSVTFSSDPRLEFFSLATDTPITADDVRSMILSAAGLGTSSGLTSDLPLFYYTMDLTGTTLEEFAAFGTYATSYAQTVPEPSSLCLAGLGVIGCIMRRRFQRADHIG